MMINFFIIFTAVALYGFVHTLSASLWMKALAEKRLGLFAVRYYRLVYNLFSFISLMVLFGLVIFLPDYSLYFIPYPYIFFSLLLQVFSAGCLLAALAQTGLGSLLGITQIKSTSEKHQSRPLMINGFYRWVRHPAYTFGLIILWLLPKMSINILAFNLSCTLYILVAIYFEERKLIREFGEDYVTYRRRTPMLIPPFF